MALAQSILSCSLVVFKYLIRIASHFNPGYFNPKLFHPGLFNQKHFQPLYLKSQGLKLGCPHPKSFNCGLFNPEFMVEELMVEKTWWWIVRVEMFWSKGPDSEHFNIGLFNPGLFNPKFMVEKFGVEESGLNSQGLKSSWSNSLGLKSLC